MPVYKIQPQLAGETPASATTRATIYATVNGYAFTATFDCDDTTIETGQDLYDWLVSKGYVMEGENYYVPTCAISYFFSESELSGGIGMYATAVTEQDPETEQDVTTYYICFDNNTANRVAVDDPTIEITFLGAEQADENPEEQPGE